MNLEKLNREFEVCLKFHNYIRVCAGASAAEAKGIDIERPFLQVHNPSYDYIPPDLISLFLTDHGHGFMPSYVYRQLSEFYHRQDYELSKKVAFAR